jgi:hypothetical protein
LDQFIQLETRIAAGDAGGKSISRVLGKMRLEPDRGPRRQVEELRFLPVFANLGKNLLAFCEENATIHSH